MLSNLNNIVQTHTFLVLTILLLANCGPDDPVPADRGTMYLTTANKQVLFEKLDGRLNEGDSSAGNPTIEVSTTTEYQQMDGFGFSLTGGSAMHIHSMSAGARGNLLQELFGAGENDIRINYLRVSIGASDLDAKIFSYNDLPSGETDENMEKFSLDPDREHLIPVLKEILAINPELKILGSPWSPPVWMKTFNIPVEVDRDTALPPTVGGGLDPQFEAAYARYFVRYVQEMAAEGIAIDAITVQNEPYHHRNNPSLHMEPEQMRDFIKNYLGPAFTSAGISTKIIIWDHNADRPSYPISILNDNAARQYIDGSAFHLYGGTIDALSTVKQAHPDKNLYFTEQYVNSNSEFGGDLMWHTEQLIIGASRNWSKNVLQWNLSSNPQLTPYTPFGGCGVCLGAITIDGNEVIRNQGYYTIAHASKFVDSGSFRIASTDVAGLPNVAFKTPNGDVVLIVLNTTGNNLTFDVLVDGTRYTTSIIQGAVATIIL